MLRELSRNWWLVLVRGIVAILFGIFAFFQPNVAALALVYVFGAYALVDGVIAIIAAIRGETERRLPFVIEGVAGIIAGVIAFILPGIAALSLVLLIAAWAVVTGVFEIVAAVRLREEIDNEWWLGIAGLLSIVFGVLVFANPFAGAQTIVFVIGIYAILFGIALVLLSFRLRDLADRSPAAI